MPDWFYHTVSKRCLDSLPAERASGLALGLIGSLGQLPGGKYLIRVMGHTQTPAELKTKFHEWEMKTPLGSGCWVDPHNSAFEAFSEFGFGFREIGPFSSEIAQESMAAKPTRTFNEIRFSQMGVRPVPDAHVRQRILDEVKIAKTPLFLRVLVKSSKDLDLVARLRGDYGDGPIACVLDFCEDEKIVEKLKSLQEQIKAIEYPVILAWSLHSSAELLKKVLTDSELRGLFKGGIMLSHHRYENGELILPLQIPALESSPHLQIASQKAPVFLAGALKNPEDAHRLWNKGALFFVLNQDFIEGGPSLPKRILQYLYALHARQEGPAKLQYSWQQSWPWFFFIGLGMCLGGLAAIVLSFTGVLLPYDESFIGWSHGHIEAFNSKILSFMAHDRITLAGAMFSWGFFTMILSTEALAKGVYWVKSLLIAGLVVGFFSFFFFLGYQYFDPFHAYISSVFFTLLVAGTITQSPKSYLAYANYDPVDSPARRKALWAQLLMVIHSVGLLVAGILISLKGITDLFMVHDLEYFGMSAEQIREANAKLIPLIAHDRATLGGMLLCTGIAHLLLCFWGFQRGQKWLWQAFFWGIWPAYIFTIAIHFRISYTAFVHLLPAYIGVLLWSAFLFLSKDYLYDRSADPH